MSTGLEVALISAAGGLVSGTVVAVVNSLLARRSFISQRWWERKAEVYTTLLTCLAKMEEMCEAEIALYGTDRELSEEKIARWREASDGLTDMMGQGRLLLSKAGVQCLENLQKSMRENDSNVRPGTYGWKLVDDLTAVQKATRCLVQAAKRDLEVPKRDRQ